MLENYNNHVKFISYDGKYPVYCYGTLVLEIDGKIYSFGDKEQYKQFWNRVCFSTGVEWKINVEWLPEELRKYAVEIDKVFNDNVPYNHCGGCL